MTMKQFCCDEVVPGCQARFLGDSDDEILAQVAVHARSAHAGNDLPRRLVSQVRAALV